MVLTRGVRVTFGWWFGGFTAFQSKNDALLVGFSECVDIEVTKGSDVTEDKK